MSHAINTDDPDYDPDLDGDGVDSGAVQAGNSSAEASSDLQGIDTDETDIQPMPSHADLLTEGKAPACIALKKKKKFQQTPGVWLEWAKGQIFEKKPAKADKDAKPHAPAPVYYVTIANLISKDMDLCVYPDPSDRDTLRTAPLSVCKSEALVGQGQMNIPQDDWRVVKCPSLSFVERSAEL
jgi:hypothetical protein